MDYSTRNSNEDARPADTLGETYTSKNPRDVGLKAALALMFAGFLIAVFW